MSRCNADTSPRRLRRTRCGATLAELLISVTSASVLLAGLTSAMMLVSRAAVPNSQAAQYVNTQLMLQEMAGEISVATAVSQKAGTSITFRVADRDGNNADETIMYSLSGTNLIRTYNGTAATILSDVQFFSLTYFTASVPVSKRVLFIHGATSEPVTTYDNDKKNLMTSWGYTVIPFQVITATTSASVQAAAASCDIVYISHSLLSTDLGTKLNQTPVPVLIEEPSCFDDFGLSSTGTNHTATSVNIVDNAHFITSGLALGSHTILSASGPQPRMTGTLAAGLQVLARNTGSATDPSLAVLDVGGMRTDGTRSPGPRIVPPWSETIVTSTLNANALALWRKMLSWCVAETKLTGIEIELQAGTNTATRIKARAELISQPRP